MKQYKLRVSEGTVLATVFRIKKEGNDVTSSVRGATVCSFDCFRNFAVWGECSALASVLSVRHLQLC